MPYRMDRILYGQNERFFLVFDETVQVFIGVHFYDSQPQLDHVTVWPSLGNMMTTKRKK